MTSHFFSPYYQTKLAQFTRTNPKWIYTEYTALNIFSLFSIFEQLALALKSRFELKFFTVFKYFFIIQDFWATYVCPENFHCIEYTFYIQDFWQLALALKNRVALKFFTVLKYYLLFRNFEQLALVLKTEFALKFFKPGSATTPASYAYGPMV